MSHTSQRPAPGTDAYWADRRAAFQIINDLTAEKAALDRAPQYLATGGWAIDALGYPTEAEIVENLGPWDRVEQLMTQAKANHTVVEILTAQNRLALLE